MIEKDWQNENESYLDIAYSSRCNVHITFWANNAFGSMIDILNNNELRFVDYYFKSGKKDNDYDVRKIHLTEDDELACPVVAEGIVVYWLRYRDQKGSAQIFEEYYEQCKQCYIQEEEKSLNAFERNLPREFAKSWHLTYEVDRIEKSEAIFPYLSEKDVKTIKKLTGYYINFVRKKGKELFPPQYTEGSEKTEAFLHVYETTAKKCVEWICDEYNLPPMGPHHGEDSGKLILDYEWYNNHHNNIEPRYIRWGFLDFEARDLYSKNSDIMEEINVNLSKCIDQDARIRYIIKLLSSFKDFAQPFYPMGKIKEWKQSIEYFKKSKTDWEKVDDDAVDEETGKPLDPKGQVEACEKEIISMEADIKYWNEKARKLYDICQKAIYNQKVGEQVSMELVLECFWREMITFYRRLTALLLSYKLKLMDIQEKCGVYLNWYVRLPDYVDEKYVTSYDYAQQLLREVEGTNVIENTAVDSAQHPSGETQIGNQIHIPQTNMGAGHTQIIPDENWDDTYDYIFDERVKPSEIKKAMDSITIPKRISKIRFYYVSCRVLETLKYLTDNTARPDFLRWVNIHFNCGWPDDKKHKRRFSFSLEDSSKNLENQHPSEWDEKTIKGGSGKYHHQLAIDLKNAFTQTMVNGTAIDNSESFEHLKDREKFLRHAYHLEDEKYFVPENAYINDGK